MILGVPIDSRTLIFLIWGLGTLVVYAIALGQGIVAWRIHRRDRRVAARREARREVIIRFAGFLAAFGAASAVFLVLLGEPGTGIRTFALTLALGGFLGLGIIWVTEGIPNRDETQHR